MNSSDTHIDGPVWDEQAERLKLLFDIELHRPLDAPADVAVDGSLKKRILAECDQMEMASETAAAAQVAPPSLSISAQPSSNKPNSAYIPIAYYGRPVAAAADSSSSSAGIRLVITHVVPKYDVEFKTETSLLAKGAATLESSASFAINVATSSSSARARALSQQKLRPICNSWDAVRCNVQLSVSAVGTELPTRCVCLTVNSNVLQKFNHLAAHVEAARRIGPDAIISVVSRSPVLPLEHVASFIELCCDWTSVAADTVPAVSLFAAAHAFGHPEACAFARRKLLQGSGVPMMALPDLLLLSHQANDVEVIGHCYLAGKCYAECVASDFVCLTQFISSSVYFASNQDLLHIL